MAEYRVRSRRGEELIAERRPEAEGESYWALVGVADRSPRGIKRAIEKGLPYASLLQLQKAYGLEFERIAAMLRVSARTLERRKASGSLGAAISDKAIRLAKIFFLARELFEGDEEGARAWLKAESPAFDGLSPAEMIDTEAGAALVEGLIRRLEQGVFS